MFFSNCRVGFLIASHVMTLNTFTKAIKFLREKVLEDIRLNFRLQLEVQVCFVSCCVMTSLGMSSFSSIVPEGEFYSEFNGTFPSIGFGKCSYLNKAFSFASWWDEAICISAILYCCTALHLHTHVANQVLYFCVPG